MLKVESLLWLLSLMKRSIINDDIFMSSNRKSLKSSDRTYSCIVMDCVDYETNHPCGSNSLQTWLCVCWPKEEERNYTVHGSYLAWTHHPIINKTNSNRSRSSSHKIMNFELSI